MGRLLALPEWGVPSQSILKMGAASPLPGTGGQRDPKHQHVVQGAGKAFPSLPTKDARFFWSLNLAGQTEQAKAGKGFFAAELQWLGWESRAPLSRRLQNHRGTATALASSGT